MKYSIFLFLFFITATGYNQTYYQTIISELCSPKYHGRGYVKKGEKKAAQYIAGELKKMQISSYTKGYFQKLNFPINSHPGKLEVIISGRLLTPGKEYLIHSKSKGCKGAFSLVFFNKNTITQDSLKIISRRNYHSSFIVIDTTGIKNKEIKQLMEGLLAINIFKARGIIEIIKGNLMYVPSIKQENFTLIQIPDSVLKPTDKIIFIKSRNKYYKKYTSQNIAGYIQGQSDSMVVFSAHYDHVGRMGKDVYFPGANDNASGIAMVLWLAKYFSEQTTPPPYSIVFLFFTGEEAGLIGSFYFAENPLFDLKKVRFLINLDMVGSGDDGIRVVNGRVCQKEFDLLTSINDEKKYLPQIKNRGAAANSDHYPFYAKGVKAVFIHTLGEYKEYHNIYDRAEKLPLYEFEDLKKLLVDFILKLSVTEQ